MENKKIIKGSNYNTPLMNAFTIENLGGYLKYMNLEDKKVLTINSCGDDLLNSAFFGAKDLTLCNPNIYAKYYLYLKIAGLLSLSYNEYCWFFLKHNMNMHINNRMFSKKLFKKIGPVLKVINEEAFIYFEDLFDIFSPKEVRDICFIDSNYHNKALKNFNIYLRNENTYNKLRDMIEKTNLHFIDRSIINTNLDSKYDSMLLSAICEELTLKKFLSLIKKLNNNLNTDGMIMLAYLWNNNIYTPEYADVWKKIYNNPESNKYLKKYITDVYEVSGYINYLWENNKRDDKVLVYRKNN